MKKVSLFILILCCNLYADYNGRLPDSVVLQNGENKNEKLISSCGNQYCYAGLPSAFNPVAYSFNYTTHSGTSSLTIVSQTPPTSSFKETIFYMGQLNVNTGSHLTLQNFHTLSIQKGINIDNAKLDVVMRKGIKITASEFGPSSKLVINTNATMQVGQNSNVSFTNGDIFVGDGFVNISKNATLTLGFDTIRFHNKLINEGEMILNGIVWNIGNELRNYITFPSVSDFINIEGKVTVNGDFNNGGKVSGDGIWDIPDPGGGNLENYGGHISITGQLTNKGDGGQQSSVKIYGGSVKVSNGMVNSLDNTLLFGAYNGQMGKLEGNLTNNGNVIVDIAGVTMGNHQLVTGNITGKNTFDILIKNNADEFVNANISNGALQINLDMDKVNLFKSALNNNELGILNGLDSKLNGIYTYGGSKALHDVVYSVDKSVLSAFISTPLSMLDSIQSLNTLQKVSGNSINVKAFGNGIMGGGVGVGGIGGLSMNYNLNSDKNMLNIGFTYGYASMQHGINKAYNNLQSHILGFFVVDRIVLNNVEVDLHIYSNIGFFHTQRNIVVSDKNLNSKEDFNTYQSGAKVSTGYRFILNNFSIKPLAGIYQEYIVQGNLDSMGDLRIKSKGYNNYVMGAILGLESTYNITNNNAIFATFSYEPIMFYSQKSMELIFEDNKIFISTIPYLHRLYISVGGDFAINDNLSAHFSTFYKSNVGNNNIFGVEANLNYRF